VEIMTGRNKLPLEREFRDFARPPKTLPRTVGHYKEWIQAAKGGKPATCDFDLGIRATEVALLGTLAARTARYLGWDSQNLQITNDRDVNALVNPPNRKGDVLMLEAPVPVANLICVAHGSVANFEG
jgi:hypothetical protein